MCPHPALTKALTSLPAADRTDRLVLRVWEADDIIEHLYDVYLRLPDDIRLAIPLKRTWVLDEEAG